LNLTPALGIDVRNVFRVHPLVGKLEPGRINERTSNIYLGEVERGYGQTLLVEFVVPARPAGSYRIAQVEVEYDVPQTNMFAQRVALDVLLTYSHDPATVPPPSSHVMNLVEKVTAFKLQTRALSEAEAGNLAGATQKLRAAATRLLDLGELDLAQKAQAQAEQFEQGKGMSAESQKELRYATRRLTQKLEEPSNE